MMADVTVSQDIAASPAEVWDLLVDLPRMPEWSPENERLEWLGGASAASVGAKFRGTNRNGSKSWKSVGQVTALEPSRGLTFRTKVGPFTISEWSYSIEATADGCRVTETWSDLRNPVMKRVAAVATGVKDRPSHNREGMTETLRRLAAAATAP